jgi:LIVCS family branched-chain amino acid:cation transporter
MKNEKTHLLTLGFAIFSMFFGAGNLIYPLEVGLASGQYIVLGMMGFLLTAVLLPFMGLIAMVLFEGDYNLFFNRLGTSIGQGIICMCMLVVGPLIALPRIVTLSHIMVAPFIPCSFLREICPLSSLAFAVIFLVVTFIATYRPGRIVGVIGNVITPILLISLGLIIVRGIMTGHQLEYVDGSAIQIFFENLFRGYETLDLMGSIFFASIIIGMLRQEASGKQNVRILTRTCLKAGGLGVALLSVVYMGMGLLGMYHGHVTRVVDAGQLFSIVSFNIMGSYGALIIATAVFMACLSTAIALSAVVARYIQKTICTGRVSYRTSLIITLCLCIPLSVYGLSTVRMLAGGPLVYVGYPVIIVLTVCNILYKMCGVQSVRIPVFITFCIALASYLW